MTVHSGGKRREVMALAFRAAGRTGQEFCLRCRDQRCPTASRFNRPTPNPKMRDVSRHKSMDVLQAYVRDADLFRDHAGVGLL